MLEGAIIIGGVVGGLITTLCWNIRRSRCQLVSTPCLSCTRAVMSVKELKADKQPVSGFDEIVGESDDSYVTSVQYLPPVKI